MPESLPPFLEIVSELPGRLRFRFPPGFEMRGDLARQQAETLRVLREQLAALESLAAIARARSERGRR